MSKRYYIDENGLIVREVPPEMLKPSVDLSATPSHERQINIHDERQKREKTKKTDVITWLRKPEKFVTCPICRAKMTSGKFRKHSAKTHNDSSIKGKPMPMTQTVEPSARQERVLSHLVTNHNQLVNCPICKIKISPKRLNKHLKKVHSINEDKLSNSNGKIVTQKVLPWVIEYKVQNLNEKRDGSNGLGLMRPEWAGKFDSFPLHDDYSDNADSD